MTREKYRTNGIILRRVNYQEADRILTILTPDYGKISAIAKGVRKQKSKLAGGLELLSESTIEFIKGKSLNILTFARLNEHYKHLLEDYERLNKGYLFLEMTGKLTDEETDHELYALLHSTLSDLNDSNLPVKVIELSFKLQLLDQLGHVPNLTTEHESEAPLESDAMYFFDITSGNLVRTSGENNPYHLPKEAITLWRLLLSQPVSTVAQIKQAESMAKRSIGVLDDFIRETFGKTFQADDLQ